MNRRSFLAALAAVPIVGALAACGDPDQLPAEADPTTPGTTPATTPATVAAAGVQHPTGADEMVLKLAYEGGFVPVGYAFVNTPTALVSGDGRVFLPAVMPAIYPGPLLPALRVHHINEEQMQSLLAVAQDAGLLAVPPDYTGADNVADAPNTVLTINANGASFIHSAYALGSSETQSGARKRLLEATNKLTTVLSEPDAADEAFVPTVYRLQARAIDATELTRQDPTPTVLDWPATTGVSLASSTECARVDASAVGSLFLDAKQNTYFKEGDIVYQLAVAGVLPGDPAC